jgi:hypothetical protein
MQVLGAPLAFIGKRAAKALLVMLAIVVIAFAVKGAAGRPGARDHGQGRARGQARRAQASTQPRRDLGRCNLRAISGTWRKAISGSPIFRNARPLRCYSPSFLQASSSAMRCFRLWRLAACGSATCSRAFPYRRCARWGHPGRHWHRVRPYRGLCRGRVDGLIARVADVPPSLPP